MLFLGPSGNPCLWTSTKSILHYILMFWPNIMTPWLPNFNIIQELSTHEPTTYVTYEPWTYMNLLTWIYVVPVRSRHSLYLTSEVWKEWKRGASSPGQEGGRGGSGAGKGCALERAGDSEFAFGSLHSGRKICREDARYNPICGPIPQPIRNCWSMHAWSKIQAIYGNVAYLFVKLIWIQSLCDPSHDAGLTSNCNVIMEIKSIPWAYSPTKFSLKR